MTSFMRVLNVLTYRNALRYINIWKVALMGIDFFRSFLLVD